MHRAADRALTLGSVALDLELPWQRWQIAKLLGYNSWDSLYELLRRHKDDPRAAKILQLPPDPRQPRVSRRKLTPEQQSSYAARIHPCKCGALTIHDICNFCALNDR